MDVIDVRPAAPEPEPEVEVDSPATGAATVPLWAGAMVAVILAGGLVLRFVARSPLWLDEALTVNIARLPIGDMLEALRHDGAPPLYYVLLHFWIELFGTGDVAVRALSGVISVAVLPAAWLAGTRLGGRRVGWAALVIAASSPFAVRFATEARMYSLTVLLTLLGFLALESALRRPRTLTLVALAVVTGLQLLTHYWAIYLVVAAEGWLVWRALRGPEQARPATRRAVVAVAAGGMLFLPWVPAFLYQLAHTGTPWAEPTGFNAVVNTIGEFAGGADERGRSLTLFLFALAGLGLLGRAINRHRIELDLRTRGRGRPLFVVVFVTLTIAIAAGLVTRSTYQPRYTAVVFGLFLLVVALGVPVLVDRRVRYGVLALTVALGFYGAVRNVTEDRTQAGDLAGAITDSARPGDLVVYCPDQLGPATNRVLGDGYEQVTFPRLEGPERVDWVDYGDRNGAADTDAFVRAVLARAGPERDIWLVWSSDYLTVEEKCADVAARLGAARPASRVQDPRSDIELEYGILDRYAAR